MALQTQRIADPWYIPYIWTKKEKCVQYLKTTWKRKNRSRNNTKIKGMVVTTYTRSPNKLLLQITIYIKSHKLPFNSYWNLHVLQNLPFNTNQISCHPLKLAYQYISSSKHNPNIKTLSFPILPHTLFIAFLTFNLWLLNIQWQHHCLYGIFLNDFWLIRVFMKSKGYIWVTFISIYNLFGKKYVKKKKRDRHLPGYWQ